MFKPDQTFRTHHSYKAFVTIACVQVALLIAAYNYLVPTDRSIAPSIPSEPVPIVNAHAVQIDRTSMYHLYSETQGSPPAAETNPADSAGTGVVVDEWRAATAANRRACLSLWLFDRAHESFCKSLDHMVVLAIREPDAARGRIAYVPVASGLRTPLGHQARFARGSTGTDGRTASLPTLSVEIAR